MANSVNAVMVPVDTAAIWFVCLPNRLGVGSRDSKNLSLRDAGGRLTNERSHWTTVNMHRDHHTFHTIYEAITQVAQPTYLKA